MLRKYSLILTLLVACGQNSDTPSQQVTNIVSDDSTSVSSSVTSTTTQVISSTTTSTTTTTTTSTSTTTTTTIPVNNVITMHTPSERIGILYEKFGYRDFIDLFPGYEGDEKANLLIQIAVNQLPDPFRTIIKEEIIVLNGCHPYGKKLFNRCVYGVFDPLGYDEEGNYGNEWSLSLIHI